MTNAEIDTHPLLSRDQQKICKALRNLAKKERRPFTMLAFAEDVLRTTANDYADVADVGELWATLRDHADQCAAILCACEAIKAGPLIFNVPAGKQGTLQHLELLMHPGGSHAAQYDAYHRAAILYVYEAIKAGPPVVDVPCRKVGRSAALQHLELLAPPGGAR